MYLIKRDKMIVDKSLERIVIMVKGLYGSQISNHKVIGYCWKHKGALTVKQLKQKRCLQKQCHALERYEHEYWRQRELIKQRRIMKRKVNKI